MSEQWAVHNTVIKNINDLIEYDSNPREHTPEQVEQVANSIREFGWTMPILIDETNEIIAGHGRLMAGKQLGIKEVPCIIAKGWSEEQKKAYCIADNKLTENSTWSKDFLKLNLTNLYDNEFDLKLTGFSDEELSRLLPDFNIDEGLTDEDDVPTPPEEPVTKLGDIWLCGEHRVMCGDSTVLENIDNLMNNKKADMIFTDPPYGMNLDVGLFSAKGVADKNWEGWKGQKKNYRKIIGDDKEFNPSIYIEIFKEVKEQFWWGADYYSEKILDKNNGSWFVWNKTRNKESDKQVQSRGSQFELCWSKQKHTREVVNTLWRGLMGTESQDIRTRVHPTQKPIQICEWFIKKYSQENSLIIDLFIGSGSTLVASDKNNRKCYGMELDPKYCDVIVKRWQNYTGQEATLESDGTKFNDMLK